MIKITTKDGITKEFNNNTTYYDIVKSFNVSNDIVGARINNKEVSLHYTADKDATIEFIDCSDIIGNKIYKCGIEFLFEVALKKEFSNYEITYQHSVPKGFLGEIIGKNVLTKDDIERIKARMAKIVQEDHLIKKLVINKREAVEFFKKIKQTEKAFNIDSINDKAVTIYELDGFYNYYYSEMPYSTKVLTKYDIIYLGNNRLIFIIPTKDSKGHLPEYIHHDAIIKSFLNGKNWLETLKMTYVSSINNDVGSGKIKDFIKSSELTFNIHIYDVIKDVIENKDIKFIMIAGPSSSGKTTTTKRLSSYLLALGYDPINISIDDFFKEREESPKDENGNYDFECLEAIDLDLFKELIDKLLNGEEVIFPTFNFVSGKKEYGNKKVKMSENSIILMEGLHALNDRLLPNISKNKKYKVYLSPFIPLNIDRHNYISTLDLRLLRRIVRDNRTRGYDVNNTIKSWQNVRKGEEKHIFPFIHLADAIINTALPYEVGVLKVYVEPLLRGVGVESEYYEEARRLLNFLKVFYPIPGEYVNKDSILREFIGGNDD